LVQCNSLEVVGLRRELGATTLNQPKLLYAIDPPIFENPRNKHLAFKSMNVILESLSNHKFCQFSTKAPPPIEADRGEPTYEPSMLTLSLLVGVGDNLT